MIAAASRASCARPYGHTLDPAAPTACDRDSVHRLPTLAEARSARDDEDSAPPSPPILNSTRDVTSCPRKHEAVTGNSFPFEAVIARNTLPSIDAFCDRPLFVTQAGGCAYNRTTRERGRVACRHAQPANGIRSRRRRGTYGPAQPESVRLVRYELKRSSITEVSSVS